MDPAREAVLCNVSQMSISPVFIAERLRGIGVRKQESLYSSIWGKPAAVSCGESSTENKCERNGVASKRNTVVALYVPHGGTRWHRRFSETGDFELPVELLRVVKLEVQPLDVALLAPFTIASTCVDMVRNVAVRLELSNGVVGWGEMPTMPPVTAEDQPAALSGGKAAARWMIGRHVANWEGLLEDFAAHLPGHKYAAVRAGVEMALLDAIARSQGTPAWRFFGGVSQSLVTDITIPICPPEEAGRLAESYARQGFSTIKIKVGGTRLSDDLDRLRAIRKNHPQCQLVVDGNGGYTAHEALQFLQTLDEERLLPALFEQPVDRDDWAGLGHVSERSASLYGVPVGADESCRSPEDARRIADDHLAQVINIKLAKVGVVGALKVAEIAQEAGLDLMIGGMVETRLGMGFAAHLAAGLGGFRWIDLDTPLLLATDPVQGGYQAHGATYILDENPGHGASLQWPKDQNKEKCSSKNGKKEPGRG